MEGVLEASFLWNCFFLLLDGRLFAFARYSFAVRVWRPGMGMSQWEYRGNGNKTNLGMGTGKNGNDCTGTEGNRDAKSNPGHL